MDKKAIQKLNLMLQGMAYRLKDEIDYFEELDGEFKSGAKNFPLR